MESAGVPKRASVVDFVFKLIVAGVIAGVVLPKVITASMDKCPETNMAFYAMQVAVVLNTAHTLLVIANARFVKDPLPTVIILWGCITFLGVVASMLTPADCTSTAVIGLFGWYAVGTFPVAIFGNVVKRKKRNRD